MGVREVRECERVERESEKVRGPKRSKRDEGTKCASDRVGRMGHGRMREKEKEDAYRIMRLAAGEARVTRGQKGEAECRESMHVHIVAAGIRKGEGRREDVEKVQRDVRRRDRYAGVYGSRPYDSGPSWLPPSHPLQLVPLSSSSSCFFFLPFVTPSYTFLSWDLHGPRIPPFFPWTTLSRLVRGEFQIV